MPPLQTTRCTQCGEEYAVGQTHPCGGSALLGDPQTPAPEDGTAPTTSTPVMLPANPVSHLASAAKATPQPPTAPRLSGEVADGIINNKYQIMERLSQGGMGVVYKARHLRLDTAVALKVLLKPEEEDAQQRFLSEAQLASKVRHPNTVYISDFGMLDDGRAFLEMEFIEGRTLAAEIDKGPIEVLRACQIAMQIARGLQAVHDKGIVHRDMKPDNVFLLEQDGTKDFVKIVDFGIAKKARRGTTPSQGEKALPEAQDQELSPLAAAANEPAQAVAVGAFTMPGNIMGTPGFMAPEQIQGLQLSFHADQYALGCILYEMIAGQPVFDAHSVHALLMKHIIRPPIPLRQRCPQAGVSEAQDAIVLRLLAKEPAARYGSMREVEEALQHEVDRIQASRGLRPGLTSGKRPELRIAGIRIPTLAPILFVTVFALGYAVYQIGHKPKLVAVELSARELEALHEQALAILRQDLKDKQPELRWAALAALGQSRDPQLLKDLQTELASPEPTTRAQAATALGALGDRRAIAALSTLLERSEPAQVKTVAAAALSQLGDGRGQRFLEQMLNTNDVDTQFRAALIVCEQGPQDVQRILRGYLSRSGLPEATELGILSCLARAGDPSAVQRLRAQVTDMGPPERRLAAATKLARIGEADGLKYLRELAKRHEREQILAARELALLGETDGLPLCRQLVGNRLAQSPARQLASDGLGAAGEPADAQMLASLLGGKDDRQLRQAGARAILQIVARDPGLLSEQSMNWARSALSDNDALVRQSATAILGDSMNAGAVLLLAGLLRDKDARVRRSAVLALGKRKDDSAVDALRNALRDEDRTVRMDALQELARGVDRLKGEVLRRALPEIKAVLAALLAQGSSQERILAGSLLYRLGDSDQLKSLLEWLRAPDAELRRLAVEQLPLTTDQLAERLGDAVLAVRLAAARRLATLGDPRAVPVLQQALELAGADAVVAYGLLIRLGVQASPRASLDTLLADANPALRIAAVGALSSVGSEQAAPILLRASRDRDPSVRRRAAEVAASLAGGTDGEPALVVLRRFLNDADAAVRARAASLLAAVSHARGAVATAPQKHPEPQRTPEKQADQGPDKGPAGTPDGGTLPDAAVPPNEPNSVSTTPPAGGSGRLIIEAKDGVQFQIDRRPWQVAGPHPLPLEAGPHIISFLSGQRELTIEPGQTVRVSIPTSQLEQLVSASKESLAHGDLKKAQRQMDKAVAICTHDAKHSAVCSALTFELILRLGRIHEQQKEWPEAMIEYQRLLAMSPQLRGKSEMKADAEAAVKRLSTRLGQVVVPRYTKRGCQEETIWMRPGSTSIKVDRKFEPIEVKLNAVVRVGRCP